jgi:hypothetical protein
MDTERSSKELEQVLICQHCEEEITPRDWVAENNAALHHACLIRMVAGSVAHQLGYCSCFNKTSDCGDPEKLTRRKAAHLAYLVHLYLREAENENERSSRDT